MEEWLMSENRAHGVWVLKQRLPVLKETGSALQTKQRTKAQAENGVLALFCFAFSFTLAPVHTPSVLCGINVQQYHVTATVADPQHSVPAVGAHTARALQASSMSPLPVPTVTRPTLRCLPNLHPQSHWWAQTESGAGGKEGTMGSGDHSPGHSEDRPRLCARRASVQRDPRPLKKENPEPGLCDGPRVGSWGIRADRARMSSEGPPRGQTRTVATTSQEPHGEGKASLGLRGGASLGQDSTAEEAAPSRTLPVGYAKC